MNNGFRLPAEWHPQNAVLFVWPHGRSDWSASLEAIQDVYERMAVEISRRQALWIVCYDQALHAAIQQRSKNAGAITQNIRYFIAPTNDTWARDTAPLTVLDAAGRGRLRNFRFNGWGGKYPHDLDDGLNQRLADQNAFDAARLDSIELVLEGGSVETDGNGTLLTTAQCLLTTTRNPRLSQPEIERTLGETLGLKRFLWLHEGYLAGDDTDSHVDNLARFTAPDTIAYVRCDDTNDEHHAALAAMEAELRQFRQPNGEPYRLVPLPWPKAIVEDGERLPASYANFLVINGAVLVPAFGDPSDALACRRIGDCFPDREIVPIDSRPLIAQRGGIHCATMQFPRWKD